MQVTIDSSEPLERVMRVVGALYGVTLSLSQNGALADGGEVSGPVTRRRGRKATKPAAARRPRARAEVGAVDAAAVRRWARERGIPVNERGPLPRTVTDEYARSGAR